MTLILRASTALRNPLPGAPVLELPPNLDEGLVYGLLASDLVGQYADGADVTSWVSPRGSGPIQRRTFDQKHSGGTANYHTAWPKFRADAGEGFPSVRFLPKSATGEDVHGSMLANFDPRGSLALNTYPTLDGPYTAAVLWRINDRPSDFNASVARLLGSQTGGIANVNPVQSGRVQASAVSSTLTLATVNAVPVGQWLPIVVVFDGENSLLRAGSQVVQGPLNPAPALGGQALGRSQATTGTTGGYDSDYAEVRLWSRAFTESDINGWLGYVEETYGVTSA